MVISTAFDPPTDPKAWQTQSVGVSSRAFISRGPYFMLLLTTSPNTPFFAFPFATEMHHQRHAAKLQRLSSHRGIEKLVKKQAMPEEKRK